MSIVRVGLAETKNFTEGYDAIFGKKEDKEEQPKEEQSADKSASASQQEKK